MLKGIVLAVVLMLSGDLVLNEGQMTHVLYGKLSGFTSASNEAVQHSLFNW